MTRTSNFQKIRDRLKFGVMIWSGVGIRIRVTDTLAVAFTVEISIDTLINAKHQEEWQCSIVSQGCVYGCVFYEYPWSPG